MRTAAAYYGKRTAAGRQQEAKSKQQGEETAKEAGRKADRKTVIEIDSNRKREIERGR